MIRELSSRGRTCPPAHLGHLSGLPLMPASSFSLRQLTNQPATCSTRRPPRLPPPGHPSLPRRAADHNTTAALSSTAMMTPPQAAPQQRAVLMAWGQILKGAELYASTPSSPTPRTPSTRRRHVRCCRLQLLERCPQGVRRNTRSERCDLKMLKRCARPPTWASATSPSSPRS